MGFFNESTTKPAIQVLEKCIPQIIISANALAKMQLYVQGCTDEIGWLGTAYKQNNLIHINDVFLFDQEVHATTTEITPEGLSTFAETLLQQPDGMEIWNNLKVWGHSHVNMGVTPSGQDNDQMVTFSEGGHDWFIRIIANKKGNMRVDLYNYELGVVYSDMPWQIGITQKELDIHNQIKALQESLKQFDTIRTEAYDKDIKQEITQKVKKKYYNQYNQGCGAGWVNRVTNHPSVQETIDYGEDDYVTRWDHLREAAKKNDVPRKRIVTDEDIKTCVERTMLLEMGECVTLKDVKDVLSMYGYDEDYYDDDELDKIWDYGLRVVYGRKI